MRAFLDGPASDRQPWTARNLCAWAMRTSSIFTPCCVATSIFFIELGPLLAQSLYFGAIVKSNVRIVGMMTGIVLMIGLGRIEFLQLDHLGDDGLGKNFRLFELRNVR